jgi:hypothetical protein
MEKTEKDNPMMQVQPPPGKHVSERWQKTICKDGTKYIQTWVRYCCPRTEPYLISEEKTNETC